MNDNLDRSLHIDISGDVIGDIVVANVVHLIVTPVVGARLEMWFKYLDVSLRDLITRHNIKVDDLRMNDVFINSVLEATQAAIRTHQEEKRQALKNIVLNSALSGAIDDDLRLIFVQHVAAFTSWHIRILHLLHNPIEWTNQRSILFPDDWFPTDLSHLIFRCYPEMSTRSDFYRIVIRNLYDAGLINHDGGTTIRQAAIFESRTTPIGKQFIEFISEP